MNVVRLLDSPVLIAVVGLLSALGGSFLTTRSTSRSVAASTRHTEVDTIATVAETVERYYGGVIASLEARLAEERAARQDEVAQLRGELTRERNQRSAEVAQLRQLLREYGVEPPPYPHLGPAIREARRPDGE